MNKKLVLSVLSTAVVASMASAAFAKPQEGFYIGGETPKYYSNQAILQDFDNALKAILGNASKVLYVNDNMEAAPFLEALGADKLEDVLKTATKADFEDKAYEIVGDPDGKTWDPVTDPDLNDPVTPGELKVESVSAINKTGVSVEFPALAEAKTGVTIEVKDNKGSLVEVKPVDLVKGETVATFKFEKELTVDPEGIWTVAGISVDLDLQGKLDAVYDAANQVALLNALQDLGLTGVNADNIAFYQTELVELKETVAKSEFTKELAQKVVTDGNEAALIGANEEAIVKAVNDAKTQVALLNALQNAAFARVNPDWIATYEADIKAAAAGDKDSIKEIQVLINAANVKGLTTLPTAATSPVGKLTLGGEPSIVKKDLEAAKALVTSYQTPDAAGESAKAELVAKIDVQLAIVKVLEAETPAQLSSAINALSAVDAAFELNMDNFKDANRAAYIAKFKGEAVNDKNTIAELNTLISDVNGEQTDAPIGKIKNATTKNELLAALKAYGEVKYVADANIDFYWANYNAGTNQFDSVTTKASVQAAIDEANLSAVVDATSTPVTTTDKENKLYAALVAYGNDIKDLNINNKAFYLAAAVNATGNEDTATGLGDTEGFADIAANTATATIKPQIQALVDIANIDALKAQTTATGVLAKLNIISQVKDVKAENAKAYLFEVTDVGGTIKALDGSAAAKDRTITNLQTAIDDVNAAEATTSGVKAVNEATTATAMRDILTDLVVSGDITSASYLNLTNADKLLVAELFMDDDVFSVDGLAGAVRTNLDADKKYQLLANIGTDLEKVASNFDKLRTDMNAVFATNAVGSVKIADVQAELAKLVKSNYTAYDDLTGTKKLAVAEAFITAFPVNKDGDTYLAGYTTMGAYTAAVDAAIAASN